MKKNFLKIAAVAIAISASAFTNSQQSANSQWVFIGENENEILDYTKYAQSVEEPSTCGAGASLPCTVDFPVEVTDQTSLQNYMEEAGRINQDVIDLSISLRD